MKNNNGTKTITTTIATKMTVITIVIENAMSKTITQVVGTLSTLTMTLVTDLAKNQILIHLGV